jgi:hypothetical protein
MTRVIKWQLLLFVMMGFLGAKDAKATTFAASSCNTSAVQAAINSASEGDTVTIPGGTCTWTSGVTISGKGIIVQGAGSGRIVAYDNGLSMVSVGTGTKTLTIAGFSTGFSGSIFVAGQTVTMYATGDEALSMTGTVTSFSGSVLTMNIASITGSGSAHRWIVATQPTTVLINNSSSSMFSVTEDTSFDTNLSGFKIAAGTGAGDGVEFISSPSGVPIVLQNCWIQQGSGDSVHTNSNRGVISNCSFDSPTFSMAPIAYHAQPYDETAWATNSYFGMNDIGGVHNFYIETSDFEAYLNATDNDEGGRNVFRYNVMNNAGYGTHGADTSPMGQRYFEYYNNTGVFNSYSDGSTFNMNWWFFVRGGTFIIHDNTLPALVSTDYGTKADANLTVMNLQRNAGPNPCWGAGTSGGADYFAPRQVGMGHVTGTGVDGKGLSTYSAAASGYSATEYAGDSEPAYIWNNSRVPLGNTGISDYGGSDCSSPDTSANYIKLNRDYFNGSTPKPGYTPYTYPHPLVLSESLGTAPAPPTGLSASVQ